MTAHYKELALAYARQGIAVLPCSRKRPLIDRGFLGASTDADQISAWWDKYPSAEIGINCEMGRLVVLDFDTYKEGCEQIVSKFEAMTGYSLGSHPYVVRSPRGGLHYYFRYSYEAPISNSALLDIGINGLDVRASGGMIIAADGERYKVVPERATIKDIPDLPHILLALMRSTEAPIPEQLPRHGNWAIERPRITAALDYIPADDRELWIMAGMAIHFESNGSEEGFDLWDSWSQKSRKYKGKDDTLKQWQSFSSNTGNPVTCASVYEVAKAAEWSGAESFSFPAMPLPLAPTGVNGDLVKRTEIALRKTFDARGHSPSGPQGEALKAIMSNIEAMANGTAPPFYFLSSVDPGVGKTQTVVHAIKEMLQMECYSNVGVLIFVGRYQEIEDFVHELGLDERDYAILVSRKGDGAKLNERGNPNRDQARVLFTTQQMLELRCGNGRMLRDIEDYHFKGRPRAVKIWDEAILPARLIRINLTVIDGMTQAASEHSDELYSAIKQVQADVGQATEDTTITLPDIEEICPAASIAELLTEEKAAVQDAAKDLWLLSGRTVVVCKDNRGNTVIDYEQVLPEDLKPILVLDASGRVRQLYKHWMDGREDLLELARAPKQYDKLTINIWKRGGGKKAWKDANQELAQAVVSAIRSKPNERWLVVHHKKRKRVDSKTAIETLLGAEEKTNVKFVSWGNHAASNQYRDIENVILAGTLFCDEAHYKALARAARKLTPEERLTGDQLNQVKLGEHANVILQGLCRGSVRKSDGASCSRCEAYIIASAKSQIPELLLEIFPGCKLREWHPNGLELSGNVRRTVEFLKSKLTSEGGKVAVPTVYNDLGMDKSNFRKDVQNHPDFLLAIEALGIQLVIRRGAQGSYFVKSQSAIQEVYHNDNRPIEEAELVA